MAECSSPLFSLSDTTASSSSFLVILFTGLIGSFKLYFCEATGVALLLPAALPVISICLSKALQDFKPFYNSCVSVKQFVWFSMTWNWLDQKKSSSSSKVVVISSSTTTIVPLLNQQPKPFTTNNGSSLPSLPMLLPTCDVVLAKYKRSGLKYVCVIWVKENYTYILLLGFYMY